MQKKSNNKTCVYTCIFYDYDSLKEPRAVDEGVDYICFTDDEELTSENWEVRVVEPNPNLPKNKQQREIKILPHKFLPNYDVTVWIDGSMEVQKSILPLLRQRKKYFLTKEHPKRNCIYEEGQEIVRQEKAALKEVTKQVTEYYSNMYPLNSGLYETVVIVRKNTEECKVLCEQWWEEVKRYTHRDQLSLPYVGQSDKIQTINHRAVQSYFRLHPHKIKTPPTIHYISPFRSDKDIGKANNDEIEKYSLKDWVCLTDADCMPLLPDYGTQIENIIMKHGHEYGLIGAVTNRLGGTHQCHEEEFSNDWNVKNHKVKALKAREKYGNSVEETSGVAGMCMIFPVKAWLSVGGFVENNRVCDTLFNKSLKAMGYKIGLAKGLYFFHAYRMDEKNQEKAKKSVEHLRK